MLHDTMLPSRCRLCSRSQLATRLTSLIMMKRRRPLAGKVCGPRKKNGEGRKRCNLLCARGIGSANLWLLHTRAHSTGHAPDDKPASDHVTPGSGGRAHECIVTSLALFPHLHQPWRRRQMCGVDAQRSHMSSWPTPNPITTTPTLTTVPEDISPGSQEAMRNALNKPPRGHRMAGGGMKAKKRKTSPAKQQRRPKGRQAWNPGGRPQ